MNRSRIPWLVNADGSPGYTWSPMTGCGPGLPCYERCWARAYHVRYRGGDFSVKLHPEKLDEPLRLRRPSTIGVCLMGDLFHEDVPDSFIRRVFRVMRTSGEHPGHCFVLLTKRPERARVVLTACFMDWPMDWPLDNVHLGVSVSNQAEADERIPILLDTPAAHRLVSLEPQVGTVALWKWCTHYPYGKANRRCEAAVDLVIQGCESGPRRRPFDLQWARDVRDQCKAAGVPYYLKQRPVRRCHVQDFNCKCRDECSPSTERCPQMVVLEKPTLDGRQHLDLPWVSP